MAELEYEIREQDLLAFNDHQLKNSDRVQKNMKRHQASIPAAMVVVALVMLFYFKDTLAALWVAVFAGLWGVLVPLYLNWSARNQVKKLYTDEVKAAVLGTVKLRTDNKHLIELGRNGESRIAWSDILRVEANKNYAFIFVTLDSALILPKATVKSGDIVEFVREVEQRIEQAG